MKKFTKLAAVFAALVLAWACFVACSNGDEDDSSVFSLMMTCSKLEDELSLYIGNVIDAQTYNIAVQTARMKCDAAYEAIEDIYTPTVGELQALKAVIEAQLANVKAEYAKLSYDKKKLARPDLF